MIKNIIISLLVGAMVPLLVTVSLMAFDDSDDPVSLCAVFTDGKSFRYEYRLLIEDYEARSGLEYEYKECK